MKSTACIVSLALLLLAANVNAADAPGDTPAAKSAAAKGPEAVVYDARAAFDFLTSMAGDWTRGAGGEHDHGSASRDVKFRVTAAGSSVMETLYPGEPSEMITMFHMDGDTLLLTHYCALGNAPILKFEKSDKPGEIRFVFHGGTNFDPKVDHHVHSGIYVVHGNDQVESNFTSWIEGKPRPQGRAVLNRKAAAAGHSSH